MPSGRTRAKPSRAPAQAPSCAPPLPASGNSRSRCSYPLVSCRSEITCSSPYSCRCCALTDERFLRAHHTELVTLGVGKDSPGLSAGLSDVHPPCPELEKAVNLLIAIGGAAGEVDVHAILDRLGIGNGHEAHADWRVLVGPDDDLVLALAQYLPAKGPRPEPGQARQIVSINDDVVQSYGHAASMRRAPDLHSADPGVTLQRQNQTAMLAPWPSCAGAVSSSN